MRSRFGQRTLSPVKAASRLNRIETRRSLSCVLLCGLASIACPGQNVRAEGSARSARESSTGIVPSQTPTPRKPGSAGTAPAASRLVSTSSVARPLALVAEDIARQSGSLITVDRALSSKKLICLVNNVPEETLLRQIARVLGGQCERTADAGGKVHYRLSEPRELHEWLRFYDRSRAAAQRVAQTRLADTIYADLKRSLASLDKAPPQDGAIQSNGSSNRDRDNSAEGVLLSRFLPDSAWRSFAQAKAAGWEGENPYGPLLGPARTPLHLEPYTRLNAEGKAAVQSIIGRLSERPRQYAGPVEQLSVTLSFNIDGNPELGFFAPKPDGILTSIFPRPLPFRAMGTAQERATLEKQDLRRRLTGHPVPAAAVLNFSLEADGTCREPVRLPAQEGTGTITGEKLSRLELLQTLHTEQKRNVVADYYTDDARLEDTPNAAAASSRTVRQTLEVAARRFGCTFLQEEQEKNFLLSRYLDFADRNYREAAYPLFEQCIALRQKQPGKLTRISEDKRAPQLATIEKEGYLPLDRLLAVCALPHEQFLALARYHDPKQGVFFPELIELAKIWNSTDPDYRMLGMLHGIAPAVYADPSGVAFDSVSVALRDFVLSDGMVRGSWQGQPCPPGGFLRLRHYHDVETGLATGWWILELWWPTPAGERQRMVHVKSIQALVPPAKASGKSEPGKLSE